MPTTAFIEFEGVPPNVTNSHIEMTKYLKRLEAGLLNASASDGP